MSDLRVGLVGYGLAGESFHAPVIDAAHGLVLTDIASSRHSRIRQRWPGVIVHETPEAFFERADIDVAVIATPNELHRDHAAHALERGWHVVVDKPFTVSAHEADELIALARSRNRVLTVYHNRRFDGDFLTIRRLLETGTLGRIHYFESRLDRYRPAVRDRWREQDVPGAGLLFDLGPHLIDQALVLFGLPLRIDARVEAQREGAVVDDFFHLVLEYPELLVVLSAGSLVRRAGPRLRLDGSLGTYVKHHPDPQEAALRAGLHPNSAGFGEEDPTHYGRITYGIDGLEYDGALKTLPGSYVSFYEMFARAVHGEGPPPVCPEEARAVMAVLEAARQSARRTSRIEMPDFT